MPRMSAPELDDAPGITPFADHLVDARGAQAGMLVQGLANELQVGIEDGGPIRHARLTLAAAIFLLPVAMILSAFGTLLVAAVGATSLLKPGGNAARGTTILTR